MVDWGAFLSGAASLLNWQIPFVLVLGTIFGVLCGSIPGLTSAMAVAILIPVTYPMDPLVGIVFLCATYVAALYGGSISSILINTPGTPCAAATAMDGFPLTQQGKANEALGMALGASCIGGTLSYLLMLFVMYPIASFALKFGSPEMFLLGVLGITIIASISDSPFYKTAFAGLFGIFISTVGISPTGDIRATFGSMWLLDGIPLIPAIVGFLAVTEIFAMLSKEFVTNEGVVTKRNLKKIIHGTLLPFKSIKNIFRSTIIGTFIGAIPAAGATIASFISYNQAKQSAKDPSSFGKGNPEGVIASETANNASSGGALTTMFALGIPGSDTTAMMIGALMLHGLQPGPRLFVSQMDLVYGIIIALVLSQLVMWIIGVLYSYSASGILAISTNVLVPAISVMAVLGAFALRDSIFDAGLMFGFGILGYFMKKNGYPTIAVILGIVLGPIMDSHLVRTAIRYNGDFSVFFTRPICLAMLAFIIFLLFLPTILKKARQKRNSAA